MRDQTAELRIWLANYQLITPGRRSSVNYNEYAGARDDTALRLPLEIIDFGVNATEHARLACLDGRPSVKSSVKSQKLDRSPLPVP